MHGGTYMTGHSHSRHRISHARRRHHHHNRRHTRPLRHHALIRITGSAVLAPPTAEEAAATASSISNDILFIDAYTSGVAGDMLCSALLHLNLVPLETIEHALASLDLGASSWFADVRDADRCGVIAPLFRVIESSPHAPRDYRTIRHLLETAHHRDGISDGAYDKASSAFALLAKAEASVHGVHVDDVHFHEVGCVDSIVDIVTASVLVDAIRPQEVIVSPLPMGRGIIRGAAHGPLPSPAPATLRVICDAGLPTFDAGIDFELITPTGACLVAAIATKQASRWPEMAPSSVGYGCGSKSLRDRANLLRVVLGSRVESSQRGRYLSIGEKATSEGHMLAIDDGPVHAHHHHHHDHDHARHRDHAHHHHHHHHRHHPSSQ